MPPAPSTKLASDFHQRLCELQRPNILAPQAAMADLAGAGPGANPAAAADVGAAVAAAVALAAGGPATTAAAWRFVALKPIVDFAYIGKLELSGLSVVVIIHASNLVQVEERGGGKACGGGLYGGADGCGERAEHDGTRRTPVGG
jgi:hypothetical protein